MYTDSPPVIYNGSRGDDFKQMIMSLLSKGKLKQKYIDVLMNDENMKIYSQTFTAASADLNNNYETFEQLGDVAANKFLVWYFYKRFPQLKCPQGVKVVARLRINYGARQSFSQIGETEGFWPFISASEEERSRKKKDLLEDCIEAFCGATEYIIDQECSHGVGYSIVYDILSSIFDKIPISLKYEDLYDAKTRLKELFDAHPSLGTLNYEDSRDELLAMSTVYLVLPSGMNKFIEIGKGTAAKKIDAQQKAAEKGLQELNRRKWVKPIPEEYKLFSQ